MKSFALPADFCRLEGSFWIAFWRTGVAIFGVFFYGASLSFLSLFWDLFFFGHHAVWSFGLEGFVFIFLLLRRFTSYRWGIDNYILGFSCFFFSSLRDCLFLQFIILHFRGSVSSLSSPSFLFPSYFSYFFFPAFQGQVGVWKSASVPNHRGQCIYLLFLF